DSNRRRAAGRGERRRSRCCRVVLLFSAALQPPTFSSPARPTMTLASENTLRDFVGNAIRSDGSNLPVRKLAGQASNRSYYRVGNFPSWVVMVMPTDATASEEKTSGEQPTELPFVNVQRYLKGLGVRVPAILKY